MVSYQMKLDANFLRMMGVVDQYNILTLAIVPFIFFFIHFKRILTIIINWKYD